MRRKNKMRKKVEIIFLGFHFEEFELFAIL